MSSTDNDMRTSAAKRSSMSRDSDDLAAQVEAIRADIQNLTSTVGRIANKQLGRVQDKAIETANEAEDAIRRNPLSAMAIAVGLGFSIWYFHPALGASVRAPLLRFASVGGKTASLGKLYCARWREGP